MVSRVVLALGAFLALGFMTSEISQAREFDENFDGDWVLQEAGSMSESSSPDWWLNSGGRLSAQSGVGETIQGDLPPGDPWGEAYSRSNPRDTDDGRHPQNLFRLVSRSQWLDFRQGFYFRIRRTIVSDSPNRNASNGILLFDRYLDGYNLYYAGVRVDGNAVIKKKIAGVYYTMASVKLFAGQYDRNLAPTLLPQNQWMGIKTRVFNQGTDSVCVQLYVNDLGGAGWRFVLEAIDSGQYGGKPILSSGFGGIRTDFMDVDFDRYVAADLAP
jgi:hypothetical protein